MSSNFDDDRMASAGAAAIAGAGGNGTFTALRRTSFIPPPQLGSISTANQLLLAVPHNCPLRLHIAAMMYVL